MSIQFAAETVARCGIETLAIAAVMVLAFAIAVQEQIQHRRECERGKWEL